MNNTDKKLEDLRNRLTMVKLDISMQGITRKDSRATQDLHKNEGSEEGMAHVMKHLIDPKAPVYKRVVKVRGLLRNLHANKTVPWGEDGWRVMRSREFNKYNDEVVNLIDQFDAAADDLAEEWDTLRNEAKRKLGSLFSEGDYPTKDELRAKFSAKLTPQILPSFRDVRLEMDADRQELLLERAKDGLLDNVQNAQQAVCKKVADELEHMHDALTRFGNKGENDERIKSFRDSLVPRMQQLANTLPQLNLMDDPKINDLAQKIATDLCMTPTKELREDEDKRIGVAEKAKDLMEDLGGYFGTNKD
jgi:hypothetical protein